MQETLKKSKKFETKDFLLCAIFAALICIGAYISIPIPPVPITMQWFFIAICGMLLGAKRGFVSSLLYMIIGLIGIPVFSGGRGGISVVFSPTFGYIYGFVFACFAVGLVSQYSKKNLLSYFVAGLIGLVVTYACGFFHLCLFTSFVAGKQVILSDLFKSAVLIFLPKDVLSTFVCALVCVKMPKNLF